MATRSIACSPIWLYRKTLKPSCPKLQEMKPWYLVYIFLMWPCVNIVQRIFVKKHGGQDVAFFHVWLCSNTLHTCVVKLICLYFFDIPCSLFLYVYVTQLSDSKAIMICLIMYYFYSIFMMLSSGCCCFWFRIVWCLIYHWFYYTCLVMLHLMLVGRVLSNP